MKSPELLARQVLWKKCVPLMTSAPMPSMSASRITACARNNEFQLEQLAIGITEAHQCSKKFFVASNLMPHNAKVKSYLADMESVIAMVREMARNVGSGHRVRLPLPDAGIENALVARFL